MGSGPMRAAAAKEELYRDIGCTERPEVAVGVLEAARLPPPEVVADLARQCGLEPARLTLAVAPTASPAGNVQIVARSAETALHKLHELGFDLTRVQSAAGLAPLPPVADDDMTGIGWTNDAILYGGDVSLMVHGDDASLLAVGPRVPSCASSDHGQPFAVLFERCGRDFYRMDKQLFSPAVIGFINVDTGRTHRFGQKRPDVLARSFGSRA
jgi:methenyltetrahydromethanopterin cyclohydrolase